MNNNQCSICSKLQNIGEIVDDSFPPEFNQLKPVGNNYSDEFVLKCPNCGEYFSYRKWTPGGSEDAMRTYVHESLDRINLLNVHMSLLSYLHKLRKYAERKPDLWDESYKAFSIAVYAELKILRRKPKIVIEEAIAYIQDQLSEKVHKSYRDEVRKREEGVAEILAEYLQYLNKPSIDLICRVAQLMLIDNENIRKTIETAIKPLIIALKDQTNPPNLNRVIEVLTKIEEKHPKTRDLIKEIQ